MTVSLDGHGADELMGAYLQDGQSGAFRLRNAARGFASGSALAKRGTDLLRALMIKRQGHYFLRGGLCAMFRRSFRWSATTTCCRASGVH